MLELYENKLRSKIQYWFIQHPVCPFLVDIATQSIVRNTIKNNTFFPPSIPRGFYSSVTKMFMFCFGKEVILNKKLNNN